MKIGFIVNPNAGVKRNAYWQVRKITESIHRNGHQIEIIPTKGPGDATQIARYFAEHKFDVVAAVGGDGTSNETAQGLVQTDTAFSIIPYGSGNGLARGLSISLDPNQAIRRLFNGQTRWIDAGEVRDGNTKRLFFGFAGSGFDAYVGYRFNQSKGRRGLWKYVRLSLSSYKEYHPVPMMIRMNDQEIYTIPFLIAVANTNEYGNNAKIAPRAIPDDGYFEVVLIQNMTLLKGIFHGWRLFNGTIDRLQDARFYRTKQLEIVPEKTIMYHLDGEPFSTQNALLIRLLPKYLKVVV